MNKSTTLLRDIRACTLCEEHLVDGVRPVLQFDRSAPIVIAGQAPGRKVHESGVPFDDPSGDRLRQWLGVDRDTFYDPKSFAILPMGFCFPGTGKSGDLPPRPECAPAWRPQLLDLLDDVQLTLVIGRYAINWHLDAKKRSLADVVQESAGHGTTMALPHPSPRNNIWLRKNSWFEESIVPELQKRVLSVLKKRRKG